MGSPWRCLKSPLGLVLAPIFDNINHLIRAKLLDPISPNAVLQGFQLASAISLFPLRPLGMVPSRRDIVHSRT